MAGIAAANGNTNSILAALISQSQQQEKLFATMDADGNGQISPGEFTAFGQNLPSIAESHGRPTQNRFSRIDSNSDGAISRAEWLRYTQQHTQTRSALLQIQEGTSAQPSHGAGRSPEATQVFNRLDTNRDGTVSSQEWAAAFGNSNAASVASAPPTLGSTVNSVTQAATEVIGTLWQTLNAVL